MGRNPHQDAIMAAREKQTDQGEPIIERERSAIANGDSIRANLTREGRDILGIEPRDSLRVQVYDDHIRVIPEE